MQNYVLSVDPGSRHTGWCLWAYGEYRRSGVWDRQQSKGRVKDNDCPPKLHGWHSQMVLWFSDFIRDAPTDIMVIEKPYPGPFSRPLLDAYNTIVTLYKNDLIVRPRLFNDLDAVAYYGDDPDVAVCDVAPAAWTKGEPKDKKLRNKKRIEKALAISGKTDSIGIDEACAILIGDWYMGRQAGRRSTRK